MPAPGAHHPIRQPTSRPVTRAWWRDAAGALTWLSLLIVVALWVSGGALQDLAGGGAGSLITLSRIAGLLSADLLLIQVLLMARIPFVERSYGQDELARRHRLVGFASVNLLVVHIVLVIIGYAAQADTGLLAQTWDLVVTYPGMLLATAATAALAMVTITSIRAARRRLRYESWHLLHLYAYLGVGLSLPHQIWTGADFIASPLARLYWWSVYAAAAASLLLYRVGLPLWRSWRHRLVVTHVVREGPDAVSVHLTGRHLDRLPIAAGQFMNWRFLAGSGWTRANPYSLSAAPTTGGLRITVKDLGDASRRIAALRPGTRAVVEGPYGRLTAAVRTRRKVTLLAGGIGVTPLRALLEELEYGPGDVTLVYRATTDADLLFRSELDRLARERGARVFYVLGPRMPDRPSWLPATARGVSDADALRQLVPDIAEHDVYICGADPWMDAAHAAATAANVPPHQIHQERFTW